MSTMGPGAAMQRRLVELLRDDDTLADPDTGLLFPDWAPQLNDDDLRIFDVAVQLPGDSVSLMQLPRVLIEVAQMSHDYEQDSDVLQGPVRVWVHTVVPLVEEELAEQIDAYIATRFLSTWLSDARIIAAKLVMDGARRRERIAEFNGAWQFVTAYSSANVGSLQ